MSLSFRFGKLDREDYLQDKLLVDVAFGHGGLEVRALQETQKEFIHQLGGEAKVSDSTSLRGEETLTKKKKAHGPRAQVHQACMTYLQMRPGGFQGRLIFLGVKLWILAGRESPEDIY